MLLFCLVLFCSVLTNNKSFAPPGIFSKQTLRTALWGHHDQQGHFLLWVSRVQSYQPMALCRLLPSKLPAAHHDFPGHTQPLFHIASCFLFLFLFFSSGLRFGNMLAGTCSQFCQENKNRSRIRCVPHLGISHLSLHQCCLWSLGRKGCLTQRCPVAPGHRSESLCSVWYKCRPRPTG